MNQGVLRFAVVVVCLMAVVGVPWCAAGQDSPCQVAGTPFRNIDSTIDPPTRMNEKLFRGAVAELGGRPVLLLSTGNAVETFDLVNPLSPVSSGAAKSYPPVCASSDPYCALVEHVQGLAVTDDVPFGLVMAGSWGWDVVAIGNGSTSIVPEYQGIGYKPTTPGSSPRAWMNAALYRVGGYSFAVGGGLDSDTIQRRAGELWIYSFADPANFKVGTNQNRRLVQLTASRPFSSLAEVFYGRAGEKHYLLVRDRSGGPALIAVFDVSTIDGSGVPVPSVVFEKDVSAGGEWAKLIESYTLGFDANKGVIIGGYVAQRSGMMIPTVVTASIAAEPTVSSFEWGKPASLTASQRLAQAGNVLVVTGGEPIDQSALTGKARVGGVFTYPYNAFPSLDDAGGVWVLQGAFQNISQVVPFQHDGRIYVVRLMTSVGDVVALDQSCVNATYSHSAWVPVASHVAGANNSAWRTDLGVLNDSSTTTNYEVFLYTPTAGVKASRAFVVGGGQAIQEDVVGQLGFVGSGVLEVRSDLPLRVTSRTYNQVSSTATCTPNGTLGQEYASYKVSDGLAAGQSAVLPQLIENSAFRSNIGLANFGKTEAKATVKLYDGAGSLLASYEVKLAPALWKQENQPFVKRAHQTNMSRGWAKVTVTSGSGVVAVASLIDNVTNDPTTVAMIKQ